MPSSRALALLLGGSLAAPLPALAQAMGGPPMGQATPMSRPPRTRFYPPPRLPTAIGVDQKRGLVGTPPDQFIAPSNRSEDKPGKTLDHEILEKNGRFKLDFDKVEIADLVQSISDITGKLFILPENIHGKITIIGPKHGTEWVTAAEAYAAFLAALDSNNLAIYPVGKFNKIVEKRDARRKPVPTLVDQNAPYPETEQYVTRLFRLKHVDPDTVNGLLSELIGPDGMTRPFQPDLLIVADQALNMHRLEAIIDQIDVPAGGDEVRIIQVSYGSAQDLAEKLQNIFQDKNKRPGAARGLSISLPGNENAKGQNEESAVNLTRVIADERTNKLVVIASPSSFDKIEALVRQLDVPVPGEGQIHVYYLENAEAEKVSTTLTNLISGISQGRRGNGQNGQPGTNQSVFEGQVKISPDKATNALVIVASGADYANLSKVIERLDRPQRQVFVEAAIMEVNIQSELDMGGGAHYIAQPTIPGVNGGQPIPIPIGAEPFALGKGMNSLLGVSGLASLGGFLTGLQGPANAAIGQALGISLPSFSILFQALETSSDTNVISTPHILTTNNEEAEITVGQNVPFQSGFSFALGGLGALGGAAGLGTSGLSGATAGLGAAGGLGALGGLGGLPIGQIQRQNVELKLKLKPQINSGDYVRLTVDESTEEIASTDPVLGPTTSKRSAKTVIVAKDQETVVIGGLMQDRVLKSSNKTPILGDIPILGWLFRYDTTKKQKVNLLLFLTPYIIRDSSDFRMIFERKMKERQEFVERFYGESYEYHVPIDYMRKSGPLGSMTVTLRHEQNKLENGGTGSDSNERAITPRGQSRRGAAAAQPGSYDPGAAPPAPGEGAAARPGDH
ncbi:MAG TPA: type II secretion system secretin GspD [Myxococcales bacterium]|nr:type II secretion system secretin GspD [Myxococcales bacterium]